ncbi:toll-like receptor 13 [Chanos chanos]|uniref:Toll-like receptor 13 n=1 Tax=Chanos chanos TaxID=29144 RepID=A0A6J2W5Q1_CHACN|nr:toll-like receptor 13 [Chanos chanos]
MSRLLHLTVKDNMISAIRNSGCPAGSKTWPVALLARIQTLDLTGNPVKIIQAGSLSVFQNLSTLSMEFFGMWLGSIWESGIKEISQLELTGEVIKKQSTNFKDLCHLISHLKLKSLQLSYIQAPSLSEEDLHECGASLKKLSIWNSKIENLSPQFWMTVVGIEIVDLVNMRLTNASFCHAANLHDARGTIWNITALNLGKNSLTVIQANQFQCMPLLEQLILSDNKIEKLEHMALNGLSRVRILKLDNNKIKQLNYFDFEILSALEILHLDNNNIEKIEHGTFRAQHELQELTLGRLDVIYELFLNMIFYGFPRKMQRLSIDAGPGTYITVGNRSEIDGPLTLELNGDLIESNDCDNAVFKAVRVLKVNGSQFTCRSSFMAPYYPNVESFELMGNAERIGIHYTGINKLRHLKRLKLTNLNFSNHTNPSMTFWNLTKLQILNLINCRLNFLMKSMFQNMSSLQLVRLYTVTPLILLDGVFEVLPSLKAVVFAKVDFSCDCGNGWLLEWAERTQRVQVMGLPKQQCIWHYKKLNFLSTMEKLCQTDVQYLCYLSTAVTIALFMSTAVGYRYARWPCLVLFFRLRGLVERKFGRRLWRRRKRRRGRARLGDEDGDEEVKFDAFVSFSSRDEAWVLGEMATRLEEQGHPRLKLCLHHRDFEVGKGIVDNIADCVYSSRCTVCVISRRYLHSDWCSLEMRVATHRLLAEQNHRLILIFLEHISPFGLSAFHRLAKLMQSRTYLDWPEDEGERVQFWDRLRRSIAEEVTVS